MVVSSVGASVPYATLPPVMKPLRSLLLIAVLLVGVAIGLAVTGWLEPFLEPILVYLFDPPKPLSLGPVDFDPFDPCLWGAVSPHDLCV